MADPASALPVIPGGPDPSKPVPRDPVDGFDLGRYATVSAVLAEGTRPREEVLAEQGLTERSWCRIELTWMLRVATSMLRGEQDLALEYNDLYVAAQDSLGPSDPVLPLDGYAVVVAHIEAGRDPAEVFAENGLSLASAARLQRAWTTRLARDPAMAHDFREMVTRARTR